MVDQNNPYNQKPEAPTGQIGAAGTTSFDQPPIPTSPPETPQVATIPTVVVSEPVSGVPKWFYFIFAITLIVFFAVTTLIVLSITQKKSTSPVAVPTIVPTLTGEVAPSVTAKPEDPIISKFNDQGSSDELTDIETDLNNTDLVELDKSLNELDGQMGVSP